MVRRHVFAPAALAVTAAVAVLVGGLVPPVRSEARSHVQVMSLRSPDGVRHDVWLYRPDGPDRADLPVLYFLHGLPGHARDVFDAGLAQLLDEAFASGTPPFVVAAPDGNGTAHSDSEWADASDGSDQLETFVTETVVTAVEGSHRRQRDQRAIAGFSMGGFGAMNLATRHPDEFGQVVTLAGYFHIDDPDGVFGRNPAVEAANRPYDHLDAAQGLRLLLLDGDHDTEPVVRGETQSFAGALSRRGVAARVVIAPGRHDWGYVTTQLPAVVSFLQAGWS